MSFSECSGPLNRLPALLIKTGRLGAGRLKSLQNDIFGVSKHAALKTLIDERLDLGSCDLNGQLSGLLLYYAPTILFGTPRSGKSARGERRLPRAEQDSNGKGNFDRPEFCPILVPINGLFSGHPGSFQSVLSI
jgi:hypothetical protein